MEQVVKDEKGNIIGFNIEQDCPFVITMKDPTKITDVNGTKMNVAFYNLLVSIRDLKLYLKGVKPNRNYKITAVKEYFGFNMKDNNIFLEYLEGLKTLIEDMDREQKNLTT